MRLPVTQPGSWYSAGLRFTCTQCGNCCTGGPGFVWISEEEVSRLASHLDISIEETLERYCRRIGDRVSLKEERNAQGYDCVFLTEVPGGKRVCGAYEARPSQCRAWPFWKGNLESKEAWDQAAVRCYGMNSGKFYSAEEIEGISSQS